MKKTTSYRKIEQGILYLIIFSAALLFLNTRADAVIYDDFNDNSIDLFKWTVDEYSAETSIEEINGRMELSFTPQASGSTFYAQLESTELLIGDFDISVDYSLLSWPYSNGVRMGLAVKNCCTNAGIQRSSLGPSEIPTYPRELYKGLETVVVETDDQAGRLRLQRIGEGVTAYYFDEITGWVDIESISPANINEDPVSIALTIWSHDGAYNPQGQTIKVAFDDLSIVPEPISSTLFIIGGATLGFRRFRKKFRKWGIT